MAIVINGSTGISPVTAAGTSALVDGMTVGRGAGEVATNTAVGASALAANTSGSTNTGIGYQAGKALTTGGDNTAIGQALVTATTGGSNIAVGNGSLYSTTTAGNNVAVGVGAAFSNTTGQYNIAVGTSALSANTTASENTAVGYQAGYTNTTGASLACFGFKAGNATTANYGTYIGWLSGLNATTGTLNTFVGAASGYLVTSGAKNTIIGGYNGNQGPLDIRTLSNYIVLSDGDGNPRLWYNPTNVTWYSPEIYGSTTASAANMFVNSAGALQRSTSALKYKQDIRDVEDFDISALRPVRYKSKCEGDDQTKDHLGLIADEAAEAGFEELVTRGADGEVEGFQYERLTVVLLKKIQVLEAKLAALENK
jgi:hypothetical protein